jgi:hypothetical protein
VVAPRSLEEAEMVEVQIRYDCKDCDGKGIVQNPVWTEFFEQPGSDTMTNEEIEQWFEDRNLMSWAKPYMGQRVRIFPDEEIPCIECEGAKKIVRWVPVASIMPGQQTADGLGVLTT